MPVKYMTDQNITNILQLKFKLQSHDTHSVTLKLRFTGIIIA